MPAIVTEDLLEKSELLKLVDTAISDEKELRARLCKAVESDYVFCGTNMNHQAIGKLSALAKKAIERAAISGNKMFVNVFVQLGQDAVDPKVKESLPLFFISPCYFGAAFCLAIINGHLDIAKKLHESVSVVLHHNILRNEVYLVNTDGTPYTKTAHDLVKETRDDAFIKSFEQTCVPSFVIANMPTLFSPLAKSEETAKPATPVLTATGLSASK